MILVGVGWGWVGGDGSTKLLVSTMTSQSRLNAFKTIPKAFKSDAKSGNMGQKRRRGKNRAKM